MHQFGWFMYFRIYVCFRQSKFFHLFNEFSLSSGYFPGLEEQCEEDEYELDGVVYTVDLKCGEIPGTFPSNTSGHLQSRLVIYSSAETLDDTKAYLEKTLLSNLAAEENGPLFAEPPVVIVFNAGHIENLDEREMLSNEGQSLADSLGCGFVDVSGSDGQPRYFIIHHYILSIVTLHSKVVQQTLFFALRSTQLLAEALQSLVRLVPLLYAYMYDD